MVTSFSILPNEYWWGGRIVGSEKMPFHAETEFFIDLNHEKRTQTVPFFLSSKGRYIWSEEPFIITFSKGEITLESQYEIIVDKPGDTLREAYLAAMRRHFPFEENIHTPREFYQHPQFNTWMELIKNQNQKDILAYAHEVIDHGYQPGLLIIDGGWQKCQGTWEFIPEKFPDPKAMFDELHQLGFQVLIWASPFVCSEGDNFLKLYSSRSSEVKTGVPNFNHLVRNKQGEVAIQKWWSGFGAILNFNLPDDCAFMADQLQKLLDYGADGFKFDGGSYLPGSFLNATEFYGSFSPSQLNQAWIKFGSQYRLHEFKDTWKAGGKPVMQRLWDKNHAWEGNGLDCLIPNGIFAGLTGSPFICPDMVGGGEWTAFVYGKHEEELFIRMAQTSALFPMMQFSSLPWRHLSEKAVRLCKEMAELHERMYPEIEKILSETEKTGEPILRSMEYQFPGHGFEKVNDQYLLGDKILVAPVVHKGLVQRIVHFPEGKWQDEQGHAFIGPVDALVDAPIEVLPWFRRVD